MILAILQARVSSSRLPGKVLKPVLGLPMILRQVERIRRSKKIDKLVLATSADLSDDPLVAVCQKNLVEYYRGSLHDVLDRFYKVACKYRPDHVVRLTGDCPLADPDLIDQVIEYHLNGKYDYTSNTIEQTYPDGLDVEIMRFSVLKRIWQEAKLASEREHVTLYVYNHPEEFYLGSVKGENNLSHLRWTVDEPEDYELIKIVYEALYPVNPAFSTSDILAYLASNSKLVAINNMHERNAGLFRSLALDREVK